MEELVKLIVAKTGISEEQARTAIQTVAGFLKERLPAPIAGQVDAVLAGSAPNLGDVGKSLGGLFGA
jgi:hypothetical protein